MKQILSYAGIAITQQPANAVGIIGGNVSFGPVLYTSQFPIVPVLQWQIQTEGAAAPWVVLTESTGFYEGCATDTLAVKALDNFLATRSTLNFRCALFYPGAAAIYTNTVTLTIAIHTNWQANAISYGAGDNGTVIFSATPLASQPVVTGFAGPYTYSWNRIGGSAAFTCTNPASVSPIFTSSGTNAMLFSIWQCTITSGLNSVVTDPLYVFAYFNVPTTNQATITIPAVLVDGGSFTGNNGGTIATQQNIRLQAIPPTVIDTPGTPPALDVFSLSGSQGGGSCANAFAYFPQTGIFNGAALGSAAFFG